MAIGKTRLSGMQRYYIILVCVDFLELKISIMLPSGLVTFTVVHVAHGKKCIFWN